MNRHALAAIMATLLCSSLHALDGQHAGSYAVIHRAGRLTDMVIHVSQQNGQWRLEQRNIDGSWKDVSCSRNCRLQDSTAADIETLISEAEREHSRFECVQNMAFAFCSYQSHQDPQQAGQLMSMRLTPTPTLVRLKKLSNDRYGEYFPGDPPNMFEIARHIASQEGMTAFIERYWHYQPQKAFASSPDGAWGHSGTAMSSQQYAIDSAMRFCERSRQQAGQIARCRIVNLNGEWQPPSGRKAPGNPVKPE